MDTARWQIFAQQFSQLSHRQRIASSNLLRMRAPQEAAVALIEQTAQAQLHCPACGATRFHRHGQAHGLQRYRCVPCRKTFNALTGTPLAYLHHKESRCVSWWRVTAPGKPSISSLAWAS